MSVDYSELIKRVLGPLQTRKVHVDLPPKKERNVRKRLGGADSQVAICAIADLTMMGSAKNALVFTPDRCISLDGEKRFELLWRDLVSVDGFSNTAQDKIGLKTIRGELQIYVGGTGKQTLPLFQEVARANGGRLPTVPRGAREVARYCVISLLRPAQTAWLMPTTNE